MSDCLDTQEVWSRFGTDLRAFVARRVPAPEVDDIVQDAFLRIHRGLPELTDRDRIAAWVYRVARSAVADHHRKHRPTVALHEEPEAPHEDDEREIEQEVASWLRPMIAALPEAQRTALTLVELEGVSQRELADRLGLSPSGARTRVQRSRAALRQTLERCCAIEIDRRGVVRDYTVRDDDCCE